MKRLTIAVAVLALLAGCGSTPSGPDQDENVIPDGSLTLTVGPEVNAILKAGPTTDLAALVASAWSDQYGFDVRDEAEEAAIIVTQRNPETIEITQTRLVPVSEAKPIPSGLEYPEFAPILEELLQSRGYDYRMFESTVTVSTIVPMTIDGGSNIDMRLTVTETLLSIASWVP